MWCGRFDGHEELDLRIWQTIKKFDPLKSENGVCFIGYDTDEGVARNFGRRGAKEGPNAIRKSLSSLPKVSKLIYDYGNLVNNSFEKAQEEFSEKIKKVLTNKVLPIGLGGGHDIAYASYSGIRKAYPEKKIGIINFDAHLDMRSYAPCPSSGTMFKQILDSDNNVNYMIIGYQNLGNTERLRKEAEKHGVVISPEGENNDLVSEKIKKFIEECDIIYTTFCMDVFDITEAPGVSAPSSIGLEKRSARKYLREIIESKKLICLDFAEVNPSLDIDNRTARLASNLIYEVLI